MGKGKEGDGKGEGRKGEGREARGEKGKGGRGEFYHAPLCPSLCPHTAPQSQKAGAAHDLNVQYKYCTVTMAMFNRKCKISV